MKIRNVILIIFSLLHVNIGAMGEVLDIDSVSHSKPPHYLIPAIGGSLVVAGSLLDFDHGGSWEGMPYTPSFSYKADEVLRFAPAVALVGMKAFGVESRTERWSELVVRSVASTAIMGLSVEATKRLVGRVRPDGSDDRSFPSGHSAAAFLTASLFAKEYGHISPWLSVGAYGVATSTAMLRRVNDHHWTSDVMVGAGIGILSTELAYALADIYYGKLSHGISSHEAWAEVTSSQGRVYMHYVLPHALSGVVDGREIRSRLGYSVGMEVDHFFTPYFGVNGRMGLTSSQMEVAVGKRNADWQVAERPLDHVALSVGPCASLPLGGGFGIGMHLRGGYGFYPKTSLVGLEVGASRGWGFEGGLSVGYLTSRRVALRLVADYRSWSSPLVGVDNQGFSLGLSAGWGW